MICSVEIVYVVVDCRECVFWCVSDWISRNCDWIWVKLRCEMVDRWKYMWMVLFDVVCFKICV